jgi:hypothetical protein
MAKKIMPLNNAPQNEEQEIKQKHNQGKVYPLTAEMDGKEYKAWVRKPNRKELAMYFQLGTTDVVRASEVLLNAIFLEGDREFIDQDELFFGTIPELQKLVDIQAVNLGK